MLRKIIGFLIVLTAIFSIVVSGLLGYAGWQLTDSVATHLDGTLTRAGIGFDSAETTLLTLQSTLIETNATLGTLESTAFTLATAITDTKPLIDQVALVVGEELPTSIETIDGTMPSLIAVADSIDTTLGALDRLSIDQTIPLGSIDLPDIEIGGFVIPLPEFDLPDIPLNFDLGIDYDPEMAFDEAIINIDLSLDGIPESLRATGGELQTTRATLDSVGNDVHLLAGDLGRVNTELAALPDQLTTYIDTLNSAQSGLENSAEQLTNRLATIRWGIVGSAAWLALTQLAPLYIGVSLLKRRQET